MKKIVIYYSFDGNTRLIAENIAKAIDSDILELKLKKETKSKSFMKYAWGLKTAMMSTKPELHPIDKDLKEFDVLFIGAPVWMWTYAPPLNTFFSTYSLSDKKIALFCCHGGQKGRTFEKMKANLADNQIIGEIDFDEPLKHNTDADIKAVKEWAVNILEGARS